MSVYQIPSSVVQRRRAPEAQDDEIWNFSASLESKLALRIQNLRGDEVATAAEISRMNPMENYVAQIILVRELGAKKAAKIRQLVELPLEASLSRTQSARKVAKTNLTATKPAQDELVDWQQLKAIANEVTEEQLRSYLDFSLKEIEQYRSTTQQKAKGYVALLLMRQIPPEQTKRDVAKQKVIGTDRPTSAEAILKYAGVVWWDYARLKVRERDRVHDWVAGELKRMRPAAADVSLIRRKLLPGFTPTSTGKRKAALLATQNIPELQKRQAMLEKSQSGASLVLDHLTKILGERREQARSVEAAMRRRHEQLKGNRTTMDSMDEAHLAELQKQLSELGRLWQEQWEREKQAVKEELAWAELRRRELDSFCYTEADYQKQLERLEAYVRQAQTDVDRVAEKLRTLKATAAQAHIAAHAPSPYSDAGDRLAAQNTADRLEERDIPYAESVELPVAQNQLEKFRQLLEAHKGDGVVAIPSTRWGELFRRVEVPALPDAYESAIAGNTMTAAAFLLEVTSTLTWAQGWRIEKVQQWAGVKNPINPSTEVHDFADSLHDVGAETKLGASGNFQAELLGKGVYMLVLYLPTLGAGAAGAAAAETVGLPRIVGFMAGTGSLGVLATAHHPDEMLPTVIPMTLLPWIFKALEGYPIGVRVVGGFGATAIPTAALSADFDGARRIWATGDHKGAAQYLWDSGLRSAVQNGILGAIAAASRGQNRDGARGKSGRTFARKSNDNASPAQRYMQRRDQQLNRTPGRSESSSRAADASNASTAQQAAYRARVEARIRELTRNSDPVRVSDSEIEASLQQIARASGVYYDGRGEGGPMVGGGGGRGIGTPGGRPGGGGGSGGGRNETSQQTTNAVARQSGGVAVEAPMAGTVAQASPTSAQPPTPPPLRGADASLPPAFFPPVVVPAPEPERRAAEVPPSSSIGTTVNPVGSPVTPIGMPPGVEPPKWMPPPVPKTIPDGAELQVTTRINPDTGQLEVVSWALLYPEEKRKRTSAVSVPGQTNIGPAQVQGTFPNVSASSGYGHSGSIGTSVEGVTFENAEYQRSSKDGKSHFFTAATEDGGTIELRTLRNLQEGYSARRLGRAALIEFRGLCTVYYRGNPVDAVATNPLGDGVSLAIIVETGKAPFPITRVHVEAFKRVVAQLDDMQLNPGTSYWVRPNGRILVVESDVVAGALNDSFAKNAETTLTRLSASITPANPNPVEAITAVPSDASIGDRTPKVTKLVVPDKPFVQPTPIPTPSPALASTTNGAATVPTKIIKLSPPDRPLRQNIEPAAAAAPASSQPTNRAPLNATDATRRRWIKKAKTLNVQTADHTVSPTPAGIARGAEGITVSAVAFTDGNHTSGSHFWNNNTLYVVTPRSNPISRGIGLYLAGWEAQTENRIRAELETLWAFLDPELNLAQRNQLFIRTRNARRLLDVTDITSPTYVQVSLAIGEDRARTLQRLLEPNREKPVTITGRSQNQVTVNIGNDDASWMGTVYPRESNTVAAAALSWKIMRLLGLPLRDATLINLPDETDVALVSRVGLQVPRPASADQIESLCRLHLMEILVFGLRATINQGSGLHANARGQTYITQPDQNRLVGIATNGATMTPELINAQLRTELERLYQDPLFARIIGSADRTMLVRQIWALVAQYRKQRSEINNAITTSRLAAEDQIRIILFLDTAMRWLEVEVLSWAMSYQPSALPHGDVIPGIMINATESCLPEALQVVGRFIDRPVTRPKTGSTSNAISHESVRREQTLADVEHAIQDAFGPEHQLVRFANQDSLDAALRRAGAGSIALVVASPVAELNRHGQFLSHAFVRRYLEPRFQTFDRAENQGVPSYREVDPAQVAAVFFNRLHFLHAVIWDGRGALVQPAHVSLGEVPLLSQLPGAGGKKAAADKPASKGAKKAAAKPAKKSAKKAAPEKSATKTASAKNSSQNVTVGTDDLEAAADGLWPVTILHPRSEEGEKLHLIPLARPPIPNAANSDKMQWFSNDDGNPYVGVNFAGKTDPAGTVLSTYVVNNVYREAGINTPTSMVGFFNGKLWLISPHIKWEFPSKAPDRVIELEETIRTQFIIHLWLGARDFIRDGAKDKVVLINKQPYFIALSKNIIATLWMDENAEFVSMDLVWDRFMDPDSAEGKIFSRLTPIEIREQIHQFLSRRKDLERTVAELVASTIHDGGAQDRIIGGLKNRADWIEEHAEARANNVVPLERVAPTKRNLPGDRPVYGTYGQKVGASMPPLTHATECAVAIQAKQHVATGIFGLAEVQALLDPTGFQKVDGPQQMFHAMEVLRHIKSHHNLQVTNSNRRSSRPAAVVIFIPKSYSPGSTQKPFVQAASVGQRDADQPIIWLFQDETGLQARTHDWMLAHFPSNQFNIFYALTDSTGTPNNNGRNGSFVMPEIERQKPEEVAPASAQAYNGGSGTRTGNLQDPPSQNGHTRTARSDATAAEHSPFISGWMSPGGDQVDQAILDLEVARPATVDEEMQLISQKYGVWFTAAVALRAARLRLLDQIKLRNEAGSAIVLVSNRNTNRVAHRLALHGNADGGSFWTENERPIDSSIYDGKFPEGEFKIVVALMFDDADLSPPPYWLSEGSPPYQSFHWLTVFKQAPSRHFSIAPKRAIAGLTTQELDVKFVKDAAMDPKLSPGAFFRLHNEKGESLVLASSFDPDGPSVQAYLYYQSVRRMLDKIVAAALAPLPEAERTRPFEKTKQVAKALAFLAFWPGNEAALVAERAELWPLFVSALSEHKKPWFEAILVHAFSKQGQKLTARIGSDFQAAADQMARDTQKVPPPGAGGGTSGAGRGGGRASKSSTKSTAKTSAKTSSGVPKAQADWKPFGLLPPAPGLKLVPPENRPAAPPTAPQEPARRATQPVRLPLEVNGGEVPIVPLTIGNVPAIGQQHLTLAASQNDRPRPGAQPTRIIFIVPTQAKPIAEKLAAARSDLVAIVCVHHENGRVIAQVADQFKVLEPQDITNLIGGEEGQKGRVLLLNTGSPIVGPDIEKLFPQSLWQGCTIEVENVRPELLAQLQPIPVAANPKTHSTKPTGASSKPAAQRKPGERKARGTSKKDKYFCDDPKTLPSRLQKVLDAAEHNSIIRHCHPGNVNQVLNAQCLELALLINHKKPATFLLKRMHEANDLIRLLVDMALANGHVRDDSTEHIIIGEPATVAEILRVIGTTTRGSTTRFMALAALLDYSNHELIVSFGEGRARSIFPERFPARPVIEPHPAAHADKKSGRGSRRGQFLGGMPSRGADHPDGQIIRVQAEPTKPELEIANPKKKADSVLKAPDHVLAENNLGERTAQRLLAEAEKPSTTRPMGPPHAWTARTPQAQLTELASFAAGTFPYRFVLLSPDLLTSNAKPEYRDAAYTLIGVAKTRYPDLVYGVQERKTGVHAGRALDLLIVATDEAVAMQIVHMKQNQRTTSLSEITKIVHALRFDASNDRKPTTAIAVPKTNRTTQLNDIHLINVFTKRLNMSLPHYQGRVSAETLEQLSRVTQDGLENYLSLLLHFGLTDQERAAFQTVVNNPALLVTWPDSTSLAELGLEGKTFERAVPIFDTIGQKLILLIDLAKEMQLTTPALDQQYQTLLDKIKDLPTDIERIFAVAWHLSSDSNLTAQQKLTFIVRICQREQLQFSQSGAQEHPDYILLQGGVTRYAFKFMKQGKREIYYGRWENRQHDFIWQDIQPPRQ